MAERPTEGGGRLHWPSARRNRRDPLGHGGARVAPARLEVRHGDDVRRHRDGCGRDLRAPLGPWPEAQVTILTETTEAVARIQIARPERKNAITADMYTALSGALTAAETDPSVRVILLHGQPDVFSA